MTAEEIDRAGNVQEGYGDFQVSPFSLEFVKNIPLKNNPFLYLFATAVLAFAVVYGTTRRKIKRMIRERRAKESGDGQPAGAGDRNSGIFQTRDEVPRPPRGYG